MNLEQKAASAFGRMGGKKKSKKKTIANRLKAQAYWKKYHADQKKSLTALKK